MQRPAVSRVEDRPPFRPENGRPVRPVSGGGGGTDDEGVVVNSSVNQQPPLNRRDSTMYAAGNRAGAADSAAVIDPTNRQWQRPAAPPYGKPPEQQYGRQTAAIPEGQEQPRYPQPTGNYNRPVVVGQPQQQDDDNGKKPAAMLQPPSSGPKTRDVQPLTRRDSVLDSTSFKMAEATLRKNDVPAAATEYGRRPQPGSLVDGLENGGRRPSDQMAGGSRRPPAPVDSQDDIGGRRTTEYKKTEQEDAVARRAPDYNNRNNRPESADYGVAGRPAMSRPEVGREDRTSTRDYQQQQRKSSSDNEPKLTVEHGNRASELRKAHFEATHMKQAKQQPYWKADGNNSRMDENKTFARGEPQRSAESKSYASAVGSSGEYNPNNKTITSSADNFDNFGDDPLSFHKNSRPDTLEIIKGTFVNNIAHATKIWSRRARQHAV